MKVPNIQIVLEVVLITIRLLDVSDYRLEFPTDVPLANLIWYVKNFPSHSSSWKI